MNVIQWIINRKVFVSMFFIGITMLGYFSYRQLPLEIIPASELPYLIISVSGRTEMDPDYIEKQAVIPKEGAASTLSGINYIETTISLNSARITVSYNADVKIKYAYLKLEESVAALKTALAGEFTINVQKVDTQSMSNTFMGLQVRGGGGKERLRAVIDQKIQKELEAINGIALVNISGGSLKSVQITLNEQACKAYNVTSGRIRQAITQNSQSKTYLGYAYTHDKKYVVNLVTDYTDVSDLENIVVNTNGPILLKDVADVTFGAQEETSISRVNGKDSITIQLVRDSQANLIDLSHTTRGIINRLNTQLAPQDVQIVVQTDSADEMEKNLNLIIELALVGGMMAIVILWLFLRNFKLVAIIALAIPISIFTAFNFFYAFGITINSLTLVGIALAVGMLLDNGVVVLENIMRLLAAHRDRTTAVLQGTTEVWRAIVASTFTTIVVFMPFIFSSDAAIRLIGKQTGVSIVSTLLVSLLVAIFLIPAITHFTLQREKDTQKLIFNKVSHKNRLVQIYKLLLKSAMRFPARTIFGAVTVFLLSVLICFTLSLNVSREVELKQFTLYLTAPKGSTLVMTDQLTQNLETRLVDIEEIQDRIANVVEEESTISVILKDNYSKIKKRSIVDIKADIQNRINQFPASEVSLSEPQASSRYGGGSSRSSGPSLEKYLGIGTPSERILVKGNDFYMMRAVAEDIRYQLDNLDSVQSVSFNVDDNRPEVHLHFDRGLMSKENITPSNIASEVASMNRQVSSSMKFKQGVEEYNIDIKNEPEDPSDPTKKPADKNADDLRALLIPTQSGALYTLDQLSRIVFGQGRAGIKRLNQEKQIQITYRFNSDVNESKPYLETSRGDVDEVIASLTLPPGVAVEAVHTETDFSEFYFLIGAAFFLIYMLLASVFESFTAPVVMMFTIPLAAIGALWALILTNNSILNANSLIGFLILLGVVVNNGILLIDYTRILRRRGFTRSRAIMMAGQARVRPILITAIVTIIGMLPLAMGKGGYVDRIGAPFAITVIGGLSLSTLFTLVFIPTVYSGMEKALEWLKSLHWMLKALQLVVLAVVALFIYTNVDSLLWKFAYWFAAVLLIPSTLYFITSSLRQAKTEYIGRDESLHIKLQRMVKIYDDDSRFVREWKKGGRIEAATGAAKEYHTWRDFNHFLWEVPLLGFVIYFVYFYIQSHLWIFLLSNIIYFYTLFLWGIVGKYLENRAKDTGKELFMKIRSAGHDSLLWGLPAVYLWVFDQFGFKIAVICLIAFVWYFALVIHTTAEWLHRSGINIMRLKGRFAGLRLLFYRFVRFVPVIGEKKNPFNALDGVSIDIENGMFGLLGPNGAGKTTLMRIVCGIFNQTMGTAWINGIDFREKREELQGLIGYLPQEFGTYENMTAYEFLDYLAILKRIYDRDTRKEHVEYALKSVHLFDKKDQKIGSYSGGMKQRMGIALTLLHLPRILVVDEPTAGLDPRERIRFRNLLVELSRDRIVLFSTHIIEDISSSCNMVAVLNRGKLAYLGNPFQMTDAVRGKVWQFLVEPEAFLGLREHLRIVHHMRFEDKIRVRCLGETPPCPGAEEVQPTMEDAYLWLLGKKHIDAEASPA
ncbi:MAG: efflux RND transporter permease subunit [Candidatus Latescibacter sp.]|nr:efflux RND transporter permease subunit [Candidatus Latescibacter sp.]